MKKEIKNILQIVVLAVVLLGLDLLTKYLFYNQELLNSLPFVAKVFNTGISRGMPLPEFVIYIISILALGLFIGAYKTKNISWLVLSLLIAGTFGNLIDRILLGGVRDFIMIGGFPVFNIADVLLNMGVILFFWESFVVRRNEKNRE